MQLLRANQWTLGKFLDYFIPASMVVDVEQHRRARMFMISHVFGPVLGGSLPIYIYVMDIVRDARVIIFLASILSFWIYPILLRAGAQYRTIAFLSVQNLAFTVIWACYGFGGLLSPFLPWVLIFPLLGFLYLPSVGWVRNLLLAQIFGNTAILLWICTGNVALPAVQLDDLEVIGIISMGSVAIYFAMMALYFAKLFSEQREFGRELNSLIASSDNLRNLTEAAEQAGTAKANFIASMSHELRTPLNAIIGYSQLLLEDVEAEGDEESADDLRKVHNSGAELLYLIDHILDYSRIEAGKMPVNPSYATLAQKVQPMVEQLTKKWPAIRFDLAPVVGAETPIHTDWNLVSAIVENIAAGFGASHGEGVISLDFSAGAEGFQMAFIAHDAQGDRVALDLIHELFDDRFDVSASKYGDAAIEFTLAAKFSELLGGTVRSGDLNPAEPTTIITFRSDLPETGAVAA